MVRAYVNSLLVHRFVLIVSTVIPYTSIRHLYRSESPFTALYPCNLAPHPSAPVTSHGTPFVTGLPPSLLPSTSDFTFFYSTAVHSEAPYVRTTSKPSDPLYHSSFLSHQLCASLPHSYSYPSILMTPNILNELFSSIT